MELTITGEFVKQVLAASKKDTRLANTLARRYLATIDGGAMASYLLTQDVAVALLADRLRKDPVGTVRALQRMPAAGGRAARGRVAPGARAGKAKRRRLNKAQSQELKRQVKAFLAKHPWATRRQLTRVVPLTTQAVYRRIMQELQDAGEVVCKGKKSKAVYALSGAMRKTTKAKPTKRKAAPKKAGAKRKAASKKTAARRSPKKSKAPKAEKAAG
jgi:hypothetical protein